MPALPRRRRLAPLALASLLAACFVDSMGATAGTTSDATTATTTNNATASSATLATTSATTGGDGSSSTGDTSGALTSSSTGETGTSDALTGGPTSTTGDATTGDASCENLTYISIEAVNAEYVGGWSVYDSPTLLKPVLRYLADSEDYIRFTPEIPCADTWYVWLHLFDDGEKDAFFVTVDGFPLAPALFEGDCGPNDATWRWALLNWRDADDGVCEFTEDPWLQSWDVGPHELVLRHHDCDGLAALLITNDPNYAP
ncbi:MAG: hypothetical protein H6713_01915 [Myxococcales bacterium]|nr:hypothetical protein [Myxococcales bacterium]